MKILNIILLYLFSHNFVLISNYDCVSLSANGEYALAMSTRICIETSFHATSTKITTFDILTRTAKGYKLSF